MAFDGVTVAAVVRELNEKLLHGSIQKAAQPEKDELLLTVKNRTEQYRLSISANPSCPLVSLSKENKASPLTAPAFCMLLRKHIGGGRIRRIFQPLPASMAPGSDPDSWQCGLERVIIFEIEHLDEMGDISSVFLSAELMGKHSNIILFGPDLVIIDSIRHISHLTSSVREVLPGRNYFIPGSGEKLDPLYVKDRDAFLNHLSGAPEKLSLHRMLYSVFVGLSPVMSEELLYRAAVEAEAHFSDLDDESKTRLFCSFSSLTDTVRAGAFSANIICDSSVPSELSAVRLYSLEAEGMERIDYDSISRAINDFYGGRKKALSIRNQSEDVRGILRNLTQRASKKLDLLEKQYLDTESRDIYRIRGELIDAYGYGLSGGESELRCADWHQDGQIVSVPLDPKLSARENALRYYEKYQKQKRAREALRPQIDECRQRLYHLHSLSYSLENCENEADIGEIRREMSEEGYIGRKSGGQKKKKAEEKSKPLHFTSSDGIDIYVGRNNYQNEELSFRLADSCDWWFHAKGIPGSHVIVKTGQRELPDRTCLEAAALAAYYSADGKGKNPGGRIEVDYVRKKELKKVPGAAPGYVIYHSNYSVMIEPRESI